MFGTLWNREKFVRPHATVMRVLKKDAHKVRWYSIFDPGTESVFAVLHAVHNPFTAEIFLLEEIYEKNRNNTSSGQIWDRAMVNERALYSASLAPGGAFMMRRRRGSRGRSSSIIAKRLIRRRKIYTARRA